MAPDRIRPVKAITKELTVQFAYMYRRQDFELSIDMMNRERIDPGPMLTRTVGFDEFPQVRFNIDIKSDAAVALLARFLDERKAHDRVLVGSFSPRRIRRFRRLTRGQVATAAHPLEVIAFRFFPSARIANLVAMERALQLPALVLLDEVGSGTDPVEGGALGAAVIDHFRRRGAIVIATTHDDALKSYAAISGSSAWRALAGASTMYPLTAPTSDEASTSSAPARAQMSSTTSPRLESAPRPLSQCPSRHEEPSLQTSALAGNTGCGRASQHHKNALSIIGLPVICETGLATLCASQ